MIRDHRRVFGCLVVDSFWENQYFVKEKRSDLPYVIE